MFRSFWGYSLTKHQHLGKKKHQLRSLSPAPPSAWFKGVSLSNPDKIDRQTHESWWIKGHLVTCSYTSSHIRGSVENGSLEDELSLQNGDVPLNHDSGRKSTQKPHPMAKHNKKCLAICFLVWFTDSSHHQASVFKGHMKIPYLNSWSFPLGDPWLQVFFRIQLTSSGTTSIGNSPGVWRHT